jgi:crotonobetainyl-CoA:carnitine CoA-transferase CaiB-like acyl-CoA transferase
MNPDVVMTHFDAFGGPRHGPRSDAVGYDDLLQASTGIMARFGGSLKTPEEHAHLGTVDVVSGMYVLLLLLI